MDNIKYNAAPVSIIAKPDPVSLDQQAKYKQQGLTVTSNNTSIIPRNDAGSIILQENSQTNPLLIIEPVSTKITTDSILRVIDTQFQYYSFPVSIRTTNTGASFDLPIAPIDFLPDPIYARYKPSANAKIGATGEFSGILIDEVVEGDAQTNINSYYITKAIKESGADIRFRVKINHRYDTPTVNSGGSTIAFSIIKQGPDYPLNRQYGQQYSSVGNRGDWGIIEPFEEWNTKFDVIIQNNEFEIGDYFGIGALASENSEFIYQTINSEQTYWVITNAAKDVDEWNREI
jgi:hypothetical protein